MTGLWIEALLRGNKARSEQSLRTNRPITIGTGYTFYVNGKIYAGWDSPRNEPQVGQAVRVFYDPSHPERNALTDFFEPRDESLGPVPPVLAGIGTVAAVIFRIRRRQSRTT